MLAKPWKLWQPHWRHKNEKTLFFRMIFTLVIAVAIPYAVINRIMGIIDYSAFDPMIQLDEWTPFISWSFWIYMTLYLYYPAAAWFGRKDDQRIREMFAFHQGLFITTWIIFLIFIVLPVDIHIRNQIPQSVLDGQGIYGLFFATLMHNLDSPYNAWPSLHVVQSLLIVLILRHWKVITGSKEVFVWLCWIALCISIMTTKQHFFWDLSTGIITGIISWKFLCKPLVVSASNQEWLETFQS